MWILIETEQIRIMINNVYLAIPKECPHLKPHLLPGNLFISITFKGRGGRRAKSTRGHIWDGGLILFSKDHGFSSPKRTKIQNGHTTSTRSWRSCRQGSVRDPNCHLVNKPSSWISPHEVLQSWLINTVKWRIIRGRGRGLKERGDY